MAQEGMFCKLVPEDVIGESAEFTNADYGFIWRVKKDKMEVATEELGQSVKGVQDRCS